jgi:hypothetical protein
MWCTKASYSAHMIWVLQLPIIRRKRTIIVWCQQHPRRPVAQWLNLPSRSGLNALPSPQCVIGAQLDSPAVIVAVHKDLEPRDEAVPLGPMPGNHFKGFAPCLPYWGRVPTNKNLVLLCLQQKSSKLDNDRARLKKVRVYYGKILFTHIKINIG